MNKSSHRSVFNRVHCVFVAVEETANAPSVIQTPNSLPQININKLGGGGVSLNTYSRFDVRKPGVIVNNSPIRCGPDHHQSARQSQPVKATRFCRDCRPASRDVHFEHRRADQLERRPTMNAAMLQGGGA
nr:ESPR-type extended signal peptide-containing protein [Burkholderia gladioli]